MGEVDLELILSEDNPRTRAVDIRVFADALRTYSEAASNVLRNGAIVSHPRTGAPIENPYLKVQQSTGRTLTQLRLKSDRALAAMSAAYEDPQ